MWCVMSVSREWNWPPLWSSGRSSWLQIQRSGFDSRRYQSFWDVVGLERGPPSLVSTIDRLSGLVVTVPGYRSRGLGSIPGHYQILGDVVGLDRLSGLVVTVPGYRSRCLGSIPGHYQILWDVVGMDRLCGLVIRVPGYRSGGLGSIPGRYQILWDVVGIDRLCGLVVRVPGYRSGGPMFDSRALQGKK
jgi:hypothetical protein